MSVSLSLCNKLLSFAQSFSAAKLVTKRVMDICQIYYMTTTCFNFIYLEKSLKHLGKPGSQCKIVNFTASTCLIF